MTDDIEQMSESELAAEREKAELEMAERLSVFGSKLSRLAEEQAQKRATIEERWLKDLRQYHGKYTEQEESRMKAAESSSIFVNITRNKSNAAEARIQDMLFPTDDRNWSIKPTPVPELEDFKKLGEIEKVAGTNVMREAESKAEKMQDEIDDQLTESSYQAKARDMLHDAVVLGTGVLKGPVIVGKTKKTWVTDEQSGVSQLTVSEDLRPGVEHVSIWDFYPDMSAMTFKDADFFFERHRWSKRQLRDFGKLPGVLTAQLMRSAAQDKGTNPTYDRISDIRAITGVETVDDKSRYEVWEYHGPIKKQEYIDAMQSTDSPLEETEIEELNNEIEAVVFFCGTNVLKVTINPMETEERPYSVLCWEKDDASPFGFGVPYLMRAAQKVINTEWRKMLDNSGQAVTDQIIVNSEIVQPVDGKWTIGPKKMWKLTDAGRSVQEAFAVFETRSRQGDYANIIQMARQFADEETNMPLIAQGEQAGHVTQTSSGMSMLMNSANIVLRRAVKNWDDDITDTIIPRFYDWNMQNSKKAHIKGDYTIDARGSSALLARDQLQEKLMMFANMTAQNEELMMRRDWAGLDKELAKSLEVPYHNVTLSDEEIETKQQQMAQQQPPPDPMAQIKQQELELKAQELQQRAQETQQKLQLEAQMQQAKLQQDYQLKMAEIAARENITVAQLQARIQSDAMRDKTARDTAAAKVSLETTKTNLQAQNLNQGYDTF